ncbi:MAG TPA: hypothetical protein VKI41_09790, partial [Vicinamibacteria bacterium]|nr:hypothetical protein [Vicinamibacteria bacterium]
MSAKRLITTPPLSWISTAEEKEKVARSVADQTAKASSSMPAGLGPGGHAVVGEPPPSVPHVPLRAGQGHALLLNPPGVVGG